jgi:integrase
MIRVICASRTLSAWGRASHNPPVVGSSPTRPTCDFTRRDSRGPRAQRCPGLYLWLVVVTGVRRGELCGLQIRDVDLDRALVHVAFNYVVRGGQRVRKDTKTHQDRWLAIDPAHARPRNPDWVSHRVADVAAGAGVGLDIKGGRHYTASQLLAGGFDLRNTAARLGHSGGYATTPRHYADPVPEVDRRAAAVQVPCEH